MSGTVAMRIPPSASGQSTTVYSAIKRKSKTVCPSFESPKADGHDRIYTHGEKEQESAAEKLKTGIPVNEKTLAELKMIGEKLGLKFNDYFSI